MMQNLNHRIASGNYSARSSRLQKQGLRGIAGGVSVNPVLAELRSPDYAQVDVLHRRVLGVSEGSRLYLVKMLLLVQA